MGGMDQRLYPRIEMNIYVDFTGEEILLYHSIENISLGGISIKAPTVEKIGTTVEILINFPESGDQIECLGEVVWSREEDEGRMGLKFIDLTEDHKLLLKSFLCKIDSFYSE